MNKIILALLALLFCIDVSAADPFTQGPGARFARKSDRSNTRNTLRPLPKRYIYVNPGLAAPPNQLIEFFVSANGNDKANGLSPGEAFKTVQGCVNHIFSNYYLNGTQPVCRLMNVNGGAGTTYSGKIEITGDLIGQQIQGGGQLLIWGTCPLSFSPWNDAVGYANVGGFSGAGDVTLSSDAAVPGQTLMSLINGAFVQLFCFTAKADGYIFDSQQFSNIFISGAVRTGLGPSGTTAAVLVAENHGQIYVGALASAGSAATAFAVATDLGHIHFIGAAGTVTFPGGPVYGQTLYLSTLGAISMGSGGVLANTLGGGTGPRCSVNLNSVVNANGTSAAVPGSGTCAVATGGQAN